VRAPPMWRNPVGEGANRVTTGRELVLALKRAFLFSQCCNATDERP
jgi:hypothetical protein